MAASLNKVFLIGNLTRDPELRYVPSGQAVATFTVAVNRVYNTQAGEKKEEVSFINVVVWARRAEVCGEYLSKGSPVFVEGRIQSRSWEDQNGAKRSTVEVIAMNVQFLRGAAKRADGDGRPPASAPEEVESIDLGADTIAAKDRKQSGAGAFDDAPADNGPAPARGSGGDEVPF